MAAPPSPGVGPCTECHAFELVCKGHSVPFMPRHQDPERPSDSPGQQQGCGVAAQAWSQGSLPPSSARSPTGRSHTPALRQSSRRLLLLIKFYWHTAGPTPPRTARCCSPTTPRAVCLPQRRAGRWCSPCRPQGPSPSLHAPQVCSTEPGVPRDTSGFTEKVPRPESCTASGHGEQTRELRGE